MPEGVGRVAKLSCKCALQILRDGEKRQGGDEPLRLSGIKRLQSKVLYFSKRDIETVCDSKWKIVEDLVTAIIGRHERVVQGPLEADLAHEAVLGHLVRNSFRRRDHLG